MPYLDLSIIKNSLLTYPEKAGYSWYFTAISNDYYQAAPRSYQELQATCQMQELTTHFWADVQRTEQAARDRLTDNLTLLATEQLNLDTPERQLLKQQDRDLHYHFMQTLQSDARHVKVCRKAMDASNWSDTEQIDPTRLKKYKVSEF